MSTAGNPFNRMFGTPPIHPALFVTSKLAAAVAWALPIIQLSGVPIRAPSAGLVPLAFLLAVTGALVLLIAALSLGGSLRVGLPAEDTTLKTTGIYRFSRHPMYLAVFLLSLASCLYCPHPVVIVCAAITVVIHHRIALAEEAFLEKQFGPAWLEYRARVPRYLGLPRRR